MITDKQALSLIEVEEIVKTLPESEKIKELRSFIKKFNKIELEKAKELIKEIESLEVLKLKQEHIKKIVDMLPEDSAELNKILTNEVNLDTDETNKILETIKKYK